MPEDMKVWRNLLIDALDSVADEEMQRRAWYGHGPEISSPDEVINQLMGDAAMAEFLERPNNGLKSDQIAMGRRFVEIMETLLARLPEFVAPDDLIDDDVWKELRGLALKFKASLEGCPNTLTLNRERRYH